MSDIDVTTTILKRRGRPPPGLPVKPERKTLDCSALPQRTRICVPSTELTVLFGTRSRLGWRRLTSCHKRRLFRPAARPRMGTPRPGFLRSAVYILTRANRPLLVGLMHSLIQLIAHIAHREGNSSRSRQEKQDDRSAQDTREGLTHGRGPGQGLVRPPNAFQPYGQPTDRYESCWRFTRCTAKNVDCLEQVRFHVTSQPAVATVRPYRASSCRSSCGHLHGSGTSRCPDRPEPCRQ
jgi:hypothetical protein